MKPNTKKSQSRGKEKDGVLFSKLTGYKFFSAGLHTSL
jgi:hypothetical protein